MEELYGESPKEFFFRLSLFCLVRALIVTLLILEIRVVSRNHYSNLLQN